MYVPQRTARLVANGRLSAGAPLLAYLILGILLIPFYRYELSPDAISYISIAQQYDAGFWKEAINPYWGPLYSWCIALLVLVHVPVLWAAKLVNVLAGGFALWAIDRLTRRYDAGASMRKLTLWVAAVAILGFVVVIDSPDLLFTAVLLAYLAIVFDEAYPSRFYSGALCGALGGLAYLLKSYGFFFFAAHFILFSALHWLMRKDAGVRRRILAAFVAGLAVFCGIAFVWMAVLHAKYGSWTLGNSGEFNHRLVGPDSAGYPHFRHLMPPSSEHATTAWEEPSPAWLAPWSTAQHSKHEIKLIYINTKSVIRFWQFSEPLFVLLVIAYIVLCFRSVTFRAEWIFPVITIALFTGGYLLVTVQDRYLWLADLLFVWIGFRMLDLLFKTTPIPGTARALATAIIVLSFIIGPARLLRGHFLRDRNLYEWTETLKRSGAVEGRMASCADWGDSAYVAYILGLPYYGVPTPGPEADEAARGLNPDYRPVEHAAIASDEISRELFAAHIDYFLEWPTCGSALFPEGSIVAKTADVKLIRLNWSR